MIRPVRSEDAEQIATIYNHYINSTFITFEETPVTAADMLQRIQKVTTAGYPWLVAEDSGRAIGWAYVSPWRDRSAYRFTVESSVYIDPHYTGKGWGMRLYAALFAVLNHTSCHVVIGGIALPNDASVALHEKFRMEKIAHFRAVGFKFNQWIDVGYWQLTLSASDKQT